MEREKITSQFSFCEVQIEETKIKSFNKDSRANHSYRVYDGEYAGIEYVQGIASDEESYKTPVQVLS